MKATKMLVSTGLALILLMTISTSADTGCEAVASSLPPPKIVSLSYTVRGTTVYFTAVAAFEKTATEDNMPREWIWDFGDGQTLKKAGGYKINETQKGASIIAYYGMDVSHTYKDYRQYTVKVSVKNTWLKESNVYVATITVKKPNYPPVVELKDVYPNPAQPNEKVTFVAEASDPDGRVTTFYWDFGDGNKQQGANLTKVTHAYSREGTYIVTVKVADDKGAISNEISVKVYVKSKMTETKPPNRAPVITSVTFSPQAPDPGATISFRASAYDPDGDSITYTWDFGDGTVKKGDAEIKYAYSKEGAYTVKVKAIDSKGLESSYYTVSVSVRGNRPPQASIISIKTLDNVTFLFQGMGVDPDGSVVAYEWNMGDGKTFTGELKGNSIPHDYLNYTYSKSGNYTVSFRVKDDKGAWSNWVSKRITVKIPEITSASLSWIGLDNLWMSVGIGAFIVIFASYLAVRDSNRNGFIERANNRKVVVRKDLNKRGQGSHGKYYRDYRTYVRKGSKKSPWS